VSEVVFEPVVPDGEGLPAIGDPLTRREAENLTEQIRSKMRAMRLSRAEAVELILQAYSGQAWRALGYQSWDAYTVEEFSDVRLWRGLEDRRQWVDDLTGRGLSSRAIGSALGVDHATVVRDQQLLAGADAPANSSGGVGVGAGQPPVAPSGGQVGGVDLGDPIVTLPQPGRDTVVGVDGVERSATRGSREDDWFTKAQIWWYTQQVKAGFMIMSQGQIGNAVGVSQARVSQIVKELNALLAEGTASGTITQADLDGIEQVTDDHETSPEARAHRLAQYFHIRMAEKPVGHLHIDAASLMRDLEQGAVALADLFDDPGMTRAVVEGLLTPERIRQVHNTLAHLTLMYGLITSFRGEGAVRAVLDPDAIKVVQTGVAYARGDLTRDWG
jgi:hypothetical protein